MWRVSELGFEKLLSHWSHAYRPSLPSPALLVDASRLLTPLEPTTLAAAPNFAFFTTRGAMLAVGVRWPPSSPLVSRDSLPSSHEPDGPSGVRFSVSSSAPETSDDCGDSLPARKR